MAKPTVHVSPVWEANVSSPGSIYFAASSGVVNAARGERMKMMSAAKTEISFLTAAGRPIRRKKEMGIPPIKSHVKAIDSHMNL